ncbi:MAG: mitotic checkpoint protein-domain-containing protein [Monoraphidium minutum]|nr:MAG: mitotic checkpoint protein-domain-containing protein [Monoraphidium minutum]
MQYSPGTTAKRLRLSDAGVGVPMGPGGSRQQHEELVELLTSRGGKIQSLEAEVEKANARAAEAERQTALRDGELRALRHESGLWRARAAKEGAAARAALFERQLQDAAAQADELLQKAGDLELSLARAEGRAAVAEAAAAGASQEEVAAQLAALRSQVRQQEEELAAAGKASKAAAAAGALQRQLERARAEAGAAQKVAARLPDVEAEAGRMRAELDQWRALFKKATGQEHPSPQAVTAMQGELLRAQQLLSDARSELAEAQTRNTDVAAARAAAQAAAARFEGEAAAAGRKLQLAEGRLAIVRKEVEGLKHLVALLEAAEADMAAGEASGGGGAEGGGAGESRVAAAKAEALAAELETARTQLAAAEALAAAAGEGEARQRKAADEAAAERQAIEREAEALGREVGRLQACVAAGDYNPETTRILHMAANPASERRRLEAEATIVRLQAECEALRRQLRAFRGGGGGGNGAAAGGGEAALVLAKKEAELAEAQANLAKANKATAKLNQIFTEHSKHFREAVRVLFGFKVDMPVAAGPSKTAVVTLRPAAPAAHGLAPGDRDPQLQFRFAPATGRVELVPTPLSRALARDVATFIEGYRSVPWFVANLTSDLCQRGAAAGGAGGGGGGGAAGGG